LKISICKSGLPAAILGVLLLGAPASAQGMAASPAPMMDIDCSKVSDMMASGGGMKTPAMTGDVDQDSMAMAKMHMQAVMMLMNVEMKCGKDPKMKAAAAKSMDYYHGSPAMYNWPLISNGG
jgi:hypothetical protein